MLKHVIIEFILVDHRHLQCSNAIATLQESVRGFCWEWDEETQLSQWDKCQEAASRGGSGLCVQLPVVAMGVLAFVDWFQGGLTAYTHEDIPIDR